MSSYPKCLADISVKLEPCSQKLGPHWTIIVFHSYHHSKSLSMIRCLWASQKSLPYLKVKIVSIHIMGWPFHLMYHSIALSCVSGCLWNNPALGNYGYPLESAHSLYHYCPKTWFGKTVSILGPRDSEIRVKHKEGIAMDMCLERAASMCGWEVVTVVHLCFLVVCEVISPIKQIISSCPRGSCHQETIM